MLRLSVYFQMPIGFAFILGLIVFPAFCLAAASARSLLKTVNLFGAFQIIKNIGFDYIKILAMSLLFLIILITLAGGIFILLSFFDHSLISVVSALAVSGFIAFYFWISFAQIIGIALYKKQFRETI